jgi:hypothetical protein
MVNNNAPAGSLRTVNPLNSPICRAVRTPRVQIAPRAHTRGVSGLSAHVPRFASRSATRSSISADSRSLVTAFRPPNEVISTSPHNTASRAARTALACRRAAPGAASFAASSRVARPRMTREECRWCRSNELARVRRRHRAPGPAPRLTMTRIWSFSAPTGPQADLSRHVNALPAHLRENRTRPPVRGLGELVGDEFAR